MMSRVSALGACLFFTVTLTAQIRPLNYQTPAYIDFEFSEVAVSEAESSVTLTVFRTGEFRWPTSIDFSTTELTATEAADFAPAGGSLVFQPGETVKTITIVLLPDQHPEPLEAFRVDLSTDNPNVQFFRSSATVDIQDHSPASSPLPVLEITPGDPGTIKISWESAPGAFILERCSSCVAADLWENAQADVTISGTTHLALDSAANGRFFYRLRAVDTGEAH